MSEPREDVARIRSSYEQATLSEADLAPTWLEQFLRWLDDALAAELPEPNAMTLATAASDGTPSARTVLLRGADERGLAFYTNFASRKGVELAANPRAALVFPWIPLQRQVVVAGAVEPVPEAEADAYFASRPYRSRLGAVASPQSQVIEGRDGLDAHHAELLERYGEDDEIPRPEFWGGFRVVPRSVEFWQGRRDRMHDRLRYRNDAGEWRIERLAP